MPLSLRLLSQPAGAIAVFAAAAALEALGDSLFQSGLYRATGLNRAAVLAAGALVLAAYGALVNVPRWDFGRLLGVYVVVFFVAAQIVNRVRFGHAPTPPIYAGGALIVAGGLVMMLWKA